MYTHKHDNLNNIPNLYITAVLLYRASPQSACTGNSVNNCKSASNTWI